MKEGDTRTLKQVCKRRECGECFKPATHKLTFLLRRTRMNPASAAYGRDDCSWCSDKDVFACKVHEKDRQNIAKSLGMVWCAAFSYERFPHMFLYWEVVK